MWHISAYNGAPAGTADTQINAILDNILKIDPTNGFVMLDDASLLFAMANCSTIQRAHLNSPKILQVTPLYIRPVNLGATPLTNPNVAWWGPNYLKLKGQESVLAYAQQTVGGNNVRILIGTSERLEPIPPGEIFTAYATSTTAAVGDTWTTLTYTLANALPAGDYAMVGSQVSSATAWAHRWVFPNAFFRPGFPSSVLETNQPWAGVLDRRLGKMGEFPQYSLPNIEVLCAAADASHQIFMDLIKIR